MTDQENFEAHSKNAMYIVKLEQQIAEYKACLQVVKIALGGTCDVKDCEMCVAYKATVALLNKYKETE